MTEQQYESVSADWLRRMERYAEIDQQTKDAVHRLLDYTTNDKGKQFAAPKGICAQMETLFSTLSTATFATLGDEQLGIRGVHAMHHAVVFACEQANRALSPLDVDKEAVADKMRDILFAYDFKNAQMNVDDKIFDKLSEIWTPVINNVLGYMQPPSSGADYPGLRLGAVGTQMVKQQLGTLQQAAMQTACNNWFKREFK